LNEASSGAAADRPPRVGASTPPGVETTGLPPGVGASTMPSVETRGLPPGVGAPGPTAWHRLDPLTRLVVSVTALIAAAILGGGAAPLLVSALLVGLPALVAGVLGRLVRLTLLTALPLALSAALVNALFSPAGATVFAELGPIVVTREGIELATEVVVRVIVMAAAVTLFYLTTRPGELVASLQAHGVPARGTFVIHNAVAMLPLLLERSAEVTAAQRARGLDTEGSLMRRLRGLLAVVSPTVSGVIAEAEMRTLALESRAFTRPGRHTLLWTPRDSLVQRGVRWALAGGVLVLALLRLAGGVPRW
jgi:energy-coupling factor transport system permease protein